MMQTMTTHRDALQTARAEANDGRTRGWLDAMHGVVWAPVRDSVSPAFALAWDQGNAAGWAQQQYTAGQGESTPLSEGWA